ncbi:MAG TPA: UDP-glucose/GDP-mannose dehydrogenase family protein [Candidatus Saccharimonadales bacterium]|nr:UDP-glucose/GDP-mannose dehydrogenase family protein [Candidatus Saccharimonadales bacterium]
MKDQTSHTISVIGAGYVGLTTAVLLAQTGFKTYLIEINPERLKVIKQGRSFFFEEGLDPLIKSSLDGGLLMPVDSQDAAVPESDFVFSCVGTPDNPDGSSNLSYVFAAAEEAAKLMKVGTTFIQKSTVPVGTGAKIEEMFAADGKGLLYVSNPEFLREGTAIADSLWPDRIVVGGQDRQAADEVIGLYKAIEKKRETIAAKAGIKSSSGVETQEFITGRNSAELIKVTANAFLALKISFANSIAKLADQAAADVEEVMEAVGSDRRIGQAFLHAGRGYGGGCFPKDVSGLIRSAEDYGVAMEIMNAAAEVNESMPHYVIKRLSDKFGGSFDGRRVAVLGLAFKAGTSDTRRSPAITIANSLQKMGAQVAAYDPEAEEEARPDLHPSIEVKDSAHGCLDGAEAVVIATDWPQFKSLDLKETKRLMSGKLILDGMNALEPGLVKKAGLEYLGVGRS